MKWKTKQFILELLCFVFYIAALVFYIYGLFQNPPAWSVALATAVVLMATHIMGSDFFSWLARHWKTRKLKKSFIKSYERDKNKIIILKN